MSPLRHRLTGLLAIAAAGALLAGCSSNNVTSPGSTTSQQDADDAAQQVGFMMSADGGASPSSMTASGGGAASRMQSALGSANPLSSPVATATDTTFTVGHITWTITRIWYDVGGNVQASYNPITTVRVAATSRGSGSIETPSDTASYGGTGTLDITGISTLQDTLRTNASRHDTLQCVFTPRFRTGRVYTYLEGAGTLANIVQAKPVSSNPWPVSGVATWTLKVDRLASNNRGSVTRHFNVAVVVTFNGTQSPDVVVTGGFRYKLNLQTGLVTRG